MGTETPSHITIRDLGTVDAGRPLSLYDEDPVKAFEASYEEKPSIGYLCSPDLPPRLDLIQDLKNLQNPHLVKTLDWEVVSWNGKGLPLVLCEVPGQRLAVSRWEEDDLTRQILFPLATALKALHGRRIAHGSLSVRSLFMRPGGLALGSCVLKPPLVSQASCYVPLPCALVDPYGRGPGSFSSDLFSVGVIILTLLMGRRPDATYESEADLTRARLAYGSYQAFVRRYRPSIPMIELLRGLLSDHPREQWTLEDFHLWVRGRRRGIIESSVSQRALRPLKFKGRSYDMAPELAYGMDEDWKAASQLIKSGELDVWMRHSLLDKRRVEFVNHVRELSSDTDELVARILMALDPSGPLRFHQYKVTAEGMGSLIAYRHGDKGLRQCFVRMVTMELFSDWCRFQERVLPRHESLRALLGDGRMFLRVGSLGLGIERLIYELNPEWPCLSPFFKDDYVPHMGYLLPALDRMCRRRSHKVERLIDRDIAAYIMSHYSHHRQDMISELTVVEDNQPITSSFAQMRILARLQNMLNPEGGTYDMCKAFVHLLTPLMEQFRDKHRRNTFMAALQRASETGILQEMLLVVKHFYGQLVGDHHEFALAQREYESLKHDITHLRDSVKHCQERAQRVGARAAGVASALMTLLALIGTYLRYRG